MSPLFKSSWFRKPEERKLSIHDGLFQIGCQACHILVHDSNANVTRASATDQLLRKQDHNGSADKVVVLIPAAKPEIRRGRLSVSIGHCLQ